MLATAVTQVQALASPVKQVTSARVPRVSILEVMVRQRVSIAIPATSLVALVRLTVLCRQRPVSMLATIQETQMELE